VLAAFGSLSGRPQPAVLLLFEHQQCGISLGLYIGMRDHRAASRTSKDIPADALAVDRASQLNKDGWAKAKRARTLRTTAQTKRADESRFSWFVPNLSVFCVSASG